jgi:hypothetical protein
MSDAEEAAEGQRDHGIPLMITLSQKATLKRLGYSPDEIATMAPADAHKIIGNAQANDNAKAPSADEPPHIETVGDHWEAPTDRQRYKHKGRGKSPEISIKRDRNAIPKGEPWVWMTQEMLESPAWRTAPLAARQVIQRIAIEHMSHGGTENGRLIVTYDNFADYGVRRNSIRFGIMVAQALGWITITEEGRATPGDTRRASRYALQWVDRHDGAPRSNRWKVFETMAQAEAVVEKVRAKLKAEVDQRKRHKASGLSRAPSLKVVA